MKLYLIILNINQGIVVMASKLIITDRVKTWLQSWPNIYHLLKTRIYYYDDSDRKYKFINISYIIYITF